MRRSVEHRGQSVANPTGPPIRATKPKTIIEEPYVNANWPTITMADVSLLRQMGCPPRACQLITLAKRIVSQ